MKLVIYKTHKRVQIASAMFQIETVSEYRNVLAKFGIEIDEIDAAKDLVAGDEVTLTVPLEQEYALDA